MDFEQYKFIASPWTTVASMDFTAYTAIDTWITPLEVKMVVSFIQWFHGLYNCTVYSAAWKVPIAIIVLNLVILKSG